MFSRHFLINDVVRILSYMNAGLRFNDRASYQLTIVNLSVKKYLIYQKSHFQFSLPGYAIVIFHTSENYVDMGGFVQFTRSIDIDYNNLHLDRVSGDGPTCGVCDQALIPTPPYGGIGRCIDDTDAEYAIQCEWNPSSTVMTFTVTGLTDHGD